MNRVLPLSKSHIVRGLDNAGAAFLRVRKVGGNIVYGDVNIRADLIRLRRTKRTTLSADNDRTVAKVSWA